MNRNEITNLDFANCKRLDIIKTLRKLWEQHVMWTRAFIVSAAADSPDLDLVTQRLLRNPTDFANELRPLYGDSNASKFEELFREHLIIAANLVSNAKAGNINEVDIDRRKWYYNALEIANFLDDLNPYWSERDWNIMLSDHLSMTENLAIQRLSGQYAADIMQSEKIEEQALAMADFMSEGIIRQFHI